MHRAWVWIFFFKSFSYFIHHLCDSCLINWSHFIFHLSREKILVIQIAVHSNQVNHVNESRITPNLNSLYINKLPRNTFIFFLYSFIFCIPSLHLSFLIHSLIRWKDSIVWEGEYKRKSKMFLPRVS